MTITDSTGAPTRPSVLQRYERAISLDGITYIPWAVLAVDLRAEADRFTGCAAQKRIDRALICETKALAQRTAAAFHAELAGGL